MFYKVATRHNNKLNLSRLRLIDITHPTYQGLGRLIKHIQPIKDYAGKDNTYAYHGLGKLR